MANSSAFERVPLKPAFQKRCFGLDRCHWRRWKHFHGVRASAVFAQQLGEVGSLTAILTHRHRRDGSPYLDCFSGCTLTAGVSYAPRSAENMRPTGCENASQACQTRACLGASDPWSPPALYMPPQRLLLARFSRNRDYRTGTSYSVRACGKQRQAHAVNHGGLCRRYLDPRCSIQLSHRESHIPHEYTLALFAPSTHLYYG